MHIVNSLGQPCPIPTVKAKQAVARMGADGGSVQILVDNKDACEDLAKLADDEGYGYKVNRQSGGHYSVMLTIDTSESGNESAATSESTTMQIADVGGLVVAVGGSSMGRGSEDLGQVLMKGFIFSLSQLEPLPKTILFFNSGVKLTAEDSGALEDLRGLAAHGVDIISCGACVNYYGCKVAVGEVGNMYNIVQTMAVADKLISL